MAEVGVLNLTINDNSEQAGKGLDKLAGALRAVKSAMEGFDLSPVGQQVKALADSINKTQATTIKSLTGLFNAVTNFSKIKSFKIDTKPFTDLRDAIGDGFKIGIAGSQLNQLREAMTGDWGDGTAIQTLRDLSDIAQTFGGGGEGIGSITNAVKDTASAMKELNKSAAAAGDWRTMMAEMSSQAQKGDRIVPFNLQFFGKKSGLGPKGEETLAQAEAMMEQINKPFEQLEENIESVSQPIESTIQEIEGNMQSFASQVQTASEETAEAMNRMFYSQMNIADFIDKPLDYMRDIYRTSTESLKGYESGINAALPSIQKLSSEEMIIAGNAKQAKAAIDGLLSRLNAPIKTKGLSDMINWSMNIGKQPLSAESSAEAFANMSDKAAAVEEVRQKAETAAAAQADFNTQIQSMDLSGYGSIAELFDNIEGKIRYVVTTTKEVFDTMKDAQARVDGLETAAKQAEASVINLSTIPATGLNGDFSSAAEELQYLTDKINEAKANMEFWGETYDKTQKRIKYNGGTEELYNMLTHAEEGFYAAGESAEQYQAALIQTQDAISAYIANTQQVIESTQAEVAAVNEAANAVAQLDNAMQQSTIAQKAAENSAAIEELFNTLNNPPQAKLSDVVNGLLGINDAAKSAQDSMAVFMDAMAFSDAPIADTVRNLNPELSELSSEMSGVTNTINGATIPALVDLDGELKQKKSDAAGAAGAFGKLGAGLKAMFPTLSGLIERFKSMAVMRMMRYMIREISKGLSEGVQNVYHYSDAVGTSFAPAMDSAATVLAQFKNSIGAAVAPLIQSLIPALNAVVNVVITAINWLNQFFALLGGQTTWTKALPVTTKAFDDQKKAAKGAGGAMKDLLADWDELNIIQSQGGGGGTGTGKTAEDYKSMFEQVSKFDGWIKDIVDGINEQFGSIWNLAKKVGLAILGWKVSNAFAGIIGTLGGLLATAMTLDLIFNVTTMFDKNFLKTGHIGWLIASFLTPMIGGVLLRKVLGKVLGGSLATIAIPLAFSVSAVADIIALVGEKDVTALSEKGILSAINTAIKGGVAAGGALYSLAGLTLGTAAAAGLGAAIFTFGATIGIKAIADTVDAGEITAQTIGANLLSAGTIGAGLAITEAVLGGTIGTIVGVGVGGALLTLAVLFATEALLANKPKNVKWGNYKATKDEITAFVEKSVFVVSPNTILNLMDPVVKVAEENKEALKTTVDEVQLTAKKLSFTFNTDDTLAELKKQIFGDSESGTTGLIGKFNETARAQQAVIETGILLMPKTETGTDGTPSQIIDETSSGWQALTGHMADLGKQLSDAIINAYKENLTDKEKEAEIRTIQELTNMMTKVSAAITQGEAEEKAMRGLTENLKGLTQGSWEMMFDYIDEYKQNVIGAYTSAYDNVTDAMAGEVAGLKEAMDNALQLANGNENDANYKAYKEEYERIKTQLDNRRAGRDKAIEEFGNNAMNSETVARVRSALAGVITKASSDNMSLLKQKLYDISGGAEFTNSLWNMLFDKNGIDNGNAEGQLKEWFNTVLEQAFGLADAQTLQKAIEVGMLGYGDVIDKAVVDELAKTIGIENQTPEIQEAWKNLIEKLTGDKAQIEAPAVDDTAYRSKLSGMVEYAQECVDKIKESIKSISTNMVLNIQANTSYAYGGGTLPTIKPRANGGPVRSGDLVMANENGNFEMMGRMGNQPVVANNQQIVNGITQGVSMANGSVVSELSTLSNLMRQLLQKEVVAKVVPSSTMGRSNQMSADAYDRVRG